MAKLPTLNVDVKVNTRTMQKDIADANKKLQQIGGKGAAFVGGGIGRIGSLGSLGGGLGSAAIGFAGISAAAMLPFKIGSMFVREFAQATKDAAATLEKFESGQLKNIYAQTGVSEIFVRRLAAAEESSARALAASGGIGQTFYGAMVNEQGQIEGAGGFISREYGVGGAETLKEQAAVAGGFLAGKSFEEMGIEAQMATSANPYAYRRELREAQVLRESGETVSPLSHPISATVDYIAKSFRDMFN